jgi:hypothetical protein
VSTSIGAAIKTGAAALLTLEDPLLLGAKWQIADLAATGRLPMGPTNLRLAGLDE